MDAVAIIPSACAPDAPRAYRVDFYAYDEIIQIDDNSSDGHKAKAYLSVEGFGTATYTTKNFREEDLNFPEGRKVSIKVCAEGTSKCSYWYAGKT